MKTFTSFFLWDVTCNYDARITYVDQYLSAECDYCIYEFILSIRDLFRNLYVLKYIYSLFPPNTVDSQKIV